MLRRTPYDTLERVHVYFEKKSGGPGPGNIFVVQQPLLGGGDDRTVLVQERGELSCLASVVSDALTSVVSEDLVEQGVHLAQNRKFYPEREEGTR